MPIREPQSAKPAWVELKTTGEDWDHADASVLRTMLTMLHLIRAFEEKVLELASETLVHGPAHSSIGQEGAAVASILPLKAGDHINGSHRGHHQFLAKALGFVAPGGLDPREACSSEVRTVLRRGIAEIMGLAEGYCNGRGGSMHLRWDEAGALGTNAIVGGGAPAAAGSAFAHRRAGTDNVAVNYFGDGAVNIGSVLETMNLAAAWSLPLCFFIENNLYAVSTHVDEVTSEPRLSSRGLGFNIPAWRVDGMDPLAVYIAMREALSHMRAGRGPTIIEAEVYRYFHQNGPLPGSAFGYRDKQEEAAWRARDPVERVGREAVARKILTSGDVEALRRTSIDTMNEIVDDLTELDGNKRRVKPALWPVVEFCDVGIRSELDESTSHTTAELDSFGGEIKEGKFIETIADVMHRRMDTDERIVVLGEDVHKLRGGTNGATRGLKAAFPDRVLGTPISENAFVGLAGGLATDGRYRPVVELMYADFMWVAADQLFNQVGKARHMFGGELTVPLVLRSKVAMGTGYGSQHSMDPAGVFATSPGWRIIAPTTPFDYVGLMNSALACEDPVLVIEHVDLYAGTGPAPADDLDYFIPLGKAKIVREGRKLTILTYLSMVAKVLDVVEDMGIDAEVIDLRSLDRAGLDWETIGASIRKTNNVLVAEQGPLGTSYGTILGDEVQRRFLDWLDGPVQRVLGGEAAPSVSRVLEAAALAGPEDIVAGIGRIMADKGEPLPRQVMDS